MDKKNKIFTFETIGWADPTESNPGKAIKWIKQQVFDVSLYPSNLINEEKPPSIVFVPDKILM